MAVQPVVSTALSLQVHSTDALPAATIDKLLATPPKEPNVTARRPRRVEPTPRREDSAGNIWEQVE